MLYLHDQDVLLSTVTVDSILFIECVCFWVYLMMMMMMMLSQLYSLYTIKWEVEWERCSCGLF